MSTYKERAYGDLKKQWDIIKKAGLTTHQLKRAHAAAEGALRQVVEIYFDEVKYPDLDRRNAWREILHIAELAIEIEKAVDAAESKARP